MNIYEIANLLLTRIANAGFVFSNFLVDANAVEFEEDLRTLVNRTRRHICEEEPTVYIPSALVTPCDLRFMFEWTSGTSDLRLVRSNYSGPAYYLLRDVRVFHRHNFDAASDLVQHHGYDWLDILEAGQLLAQLRHDRNCPPEQIGLGSVTTNNHGLSFKSVPYSSQLHTLFHNENAKARVPMDWERNHHVAICKERVGLPGGRLYYGAIRPCL